MTHYWLNIKKEKDLEKYMEERYGEKENKRR